MNYSQEPHEIPIDTMNINYMNGNLITTRQCCLLLQSDQNKEHARAYRPSPSNYLPFLVETHVGVQKKSFSFYHKTKHSPGDQKF